MTPLRISTLVLFLFALVLLLATTSPSLAQQFPVTPTSTTLFRWPVSDTAPIERHEVLSNAQIQVLEIGAIAGNGTFEIRDSVFFRVDVLNSTLLHQGRLILRNCRLSHFYCATRTISGLSASIEVRDSTFLPPSEINTLLAAGLTPQQQIQVVAGEFVGLFARWMRAYLRVISSDGGKVIFSGNRLDSEFSATVNATQLLPANDAFALTVVRVDLVFNEPGPSHFEMEDNTVLSVNGASAVVVALHGFPDARKFSFRRNNISVTGSWPVIENLICFEKFVGWKKQQQQQAGSSAPTAPSNGTTTAQQPATTTTMGNETQQEEKLYNENSSFVIDDNVFFQRSPRSTDSGGNTLRVSACGGSTKSRMDFTGFALVSMSNNTVDASGTHALFARWQTVTFSNHKLVRFNNNVVRFDPTTAQLLPGKPSGFTGIWVQIDGNMTNIEHFDYSWNRVENLQCGYAIRFFTHTPALDPQWRNSVSCSNIGNITFTNNHVSTDNNTGNGNSNSSSNSVTSSPTQCASQRIYGLDYQLPNCSSGGMVLVSDNKVSIAGPEPQGVRLYVEDGQHSLQHGVWIARNTVNCTTIHRAGATAAEQSADQLEAYAIRLRMNDAVNCNFFVEDNVARLTQHQQQSTGGGVVDFAVQLPVGIDLHTNRNENLNLTVRRNDVTVSDFRLTHSILTVAAALLLDANTVKTVKLHNVFITNNVLRMFDPHNCPHIGCSVVQIVAATVTAVSGAIRIDSNTIIANSSRANPTATEVALSGAPRPVTSLSALSILTLTAENIGVTLFPNVGLILNTRARFSGVKELSFSDNTVSLRGPSCASAVFFANAGLVEIEMLRVDRNKVDVWLWDQNSTEVISSTVATGGAISALATACQGTAMLLSTFPPDVYAKESGIGPTKWDILQPLGHDTILHRVSLSKNSFRIVEGLSQSMLHFHDGNVTAVNISRAAGSLYANLSSLVSNPPSASTQDDAARRNRTLAATPRRAARSTCGFPTGFWISENSFNFSMTSSSPSSSSTASSSACDGENLCLFTGISGSSLSSSSAADFVQMCLDRQPLSITAPGAASLWRMDGVVTTATGTAAPSRPRQLHVSVRDSTIDVTCNTAEALGDGNSLAAGTGVAASCSLITTTTTSAVSGVTSRRNVVNFNSARSTLSISAHGAPSIAFVSGRFGAPGKSSVRFENNTILKVTELTRHGDKTKPATVSLTDMPMGTAVELDAVTFIHVDQQPANERFTINETLLMPPFRTLFAFSRIAAETHGEATASSVAPPNSAIDPLLPTTASIILDIINFNITTAPSSNRNFYRLTDFGHVPFRALSKLYFAIVECVTFNGAPGKQANTFFASFFQPSDLVITRIFEPCPQTQSLSLSQSISEVPFCAPFELVPADQHLLSLRTDVVRDTTQTLRFAILLDSQRDTPAPLTFGKRWLTGPTNPPPGLPQSEAVTHFQLGLGNISTHTDPQVVKRLGPPDLRMLTEEEQQRYGFGLGFLRNGSQVSRASKMVLTTQVRFFGYLDADNEYEVKINVSTRLLACRSTSKWVTAKLTLRPRFQAISADVLAASYSAGDVASILTLPVSGVTAAVALSRINALVSIYRCPAAAANTPLSFIESPFGWTSGFAWGIYYRGAIIGNITIIVIVAALCGAFALFKMYRHMREPRTAAAAAGQEEQDVEVIVRDGRTYRVPKQLQQQQQQQQSPKSPALSLTPRRAKKSSPRSPALTIGGRKPQNVAELMKLRSGQALPSNADDIFGGVGNKKQLPLWTALGLAQFPSILIVPATFLLQGTVSSGAAVLFRRILVPEDAGPNDRFLGGLSIALYVVMALLFAFVVFYVLRKKQHWVAFKPRSVEQRRDLPKMPAADLKNAVRRLFPGCGRCLDYADEYKVRYKHILEGNNNSNGSSKESARRCSNKNNRNNNKSPSKRGTSPTLTSNMTRRSATPLLRSSTVLDNNNANRSNSTPLLLIPRGASSMRTGTPAPRTPRGGGRETPTFNLDPANASFRAFSSDGDNDDRDSLFSGEATTPTMTRSVKSRRGHQQQRRRQSLAEHAAAFLLQYVFFVKGDWVADREPKDPAVAALPHDPLFLSRYGRCFSSCTGDVRWFPTFHLIEGILLGIFSGYSRQSGDCNEVLQLLTAIVVVIVFVVVAQARPKRRSTATAFMLWMQLLGVGMCLSGLAAQYLAKTQPAESDVAFTAFAVFHVIAGFSSIPLMIVDGLFMILMIAAPKFPLLQAIFTHVSVHRRWKLLGKSGDDDEAGAMSLKELMRRRGSQLDPEQRARLVQHRVEKFVAPLPLEPRSMRAPSVCWDLLHDPYVSTPVASRSVSMMPPASSAIFTMEPSQINSRRSRSKPRQEVDQLSKNKENSGDLSDGNVDGNAVDDDDIELNYNSGDEANMSSAWRRRQQKRRRYEERMRAASPSITMLSSIGVRPETPTRSNSRAASVAAWTGRSASRGPSQAFFSNNQQQHRGATPTAGYDEDIDEFLPPVLAARSQQMQQQQQQRPPPLRRQDSRGSTGGRRDYYQHRQEDNNNDDDFLSDFDEPDDGDDNSNRDDAAAAEYFSDDDQDAVIGERVLNEYKRRAAQYALL